MSEVNETPPLETPPAETPPTSLVTAPVVRSAEEIAAEAETTRIAALTPEARAAEEKAASEAAARAEAMKAPVAVEAIKLPDGVTLPEGGLDPLITVMNNAELTPAERTQALVDLHVKALADASEAGSKAWEETQEQWQTETKAAPDIGGPKLLATLATIGKLKEQFGSKELDDVFALTGAGNNVHMIRFLAKIGEHLTEGGPVTSAPVNAEADRARKMYPSMNA